MTFRPTLLALGLSIVAAHVTTDALASGDAAKGKVLADTCHGCHGVPKYKNAYPDYSVPKLGGQRAEYLVTALKGYAAGDRPHQTMHAQASTLSDQDRADIAAFLQGEPVQSGPAVIGTPPPAAATCAACHGNDGAKPTLPEYPVLAGQYRDYILQALKDYKAGKRKNAVMGGIIAGVKEEDFAALAEFFSKQQPGICGTDTILAKGKCR